MPDVRLAGRVVFVVLALGCVLLAYGALKNLWGYQDSSTGLYVGVGAFWMAVAAAFLFIAVRLLRRP
jgi:hypothetical protein